MLIHFLLVLLFATSAIAAEEFRQVSLEKIWDAAPHNAFTDLERFQDRWFCAFREGDGHVATGDHGKVRIISSTDGSTWASTALLESPGLDLRDAKLSITPDGRLLLNSCEYDVDHDDPVNRNNQSVTYLSEDGVTWEGPHRVAEKGYWLWQTAWQDTIGYALGYKWGSNGATRLYTTTDGLTYEMLVDHLRPPNDRGNEHATVFMPDGTAHLLLRRDNRDRLESTDALLGTSEAPYLDWEWRKLDHRLGGPAMMRLPSGRLLTAARRYGSEEWTELGFIDPDKGQYEAGLRLPSKGDSSYAGLVWHEDLLWMSYYSSHEGKTAIYLAQIAIPSEVPTPYDENRFSDTVLAKDLQRPLELDIAPDGRVFFIELDGKLKIHHPDTGETTLAAEIEVFAKQEGGLIGLTLDPDFENNQWLYLMYSPPTEVFSGEYVSRFDMNGDVLDMGSERIVIAIPTQRDDCCHHAGSLEFGPKGNLFISTGDNTHPGGAPSGFGPMDEREGNHVYDAQDTAGNTNDLRGTILRIRPRPDGSYAIPEGNLFPENGAIRGLPEIYVMGCRNPWRMNVDQRTGYVYWGEVGPDAGGEAPRGPRGYDELNQARAAGNFGWPFFIADNKPYADHDYATGETGPLYDVERPENRSPTNTGSVLLPKPQPAWIYYPYADSKEFPMLGSGGRTACAGPIYHFDSELDSPTKLPPQLDQSLIIFDWERRFIKRVRLDDDSNIVSIDPFLTEINIHRAVDMKIGPEGALYVLDYGSTWGINAEARLLRIDYHPGNRPPDAKLVSTSGTIGKHPFNAKFSASESRDRDEGDTLSYTWNVRPGDIPSQTSEEATFTLTEPGEYEVELTVRDQDGSEDTDVIALTIGNEPPRVQFLKPTDGGFFDWEEEIAYEVVIDDAEDGSSKNASEVMRTRLLLNQFFQADAPGSAEAAYLSGSGQHAAGLSMIQKSDCLNCHAIDRRVVGPSFTEIAQRYAEVEDIKAAVQTTANRIKNGSSKVWGEIPMLPHADMTRKETEAIVRWVFSLKDINTSDAVSQDFEGTTKATRPNWLEGKPGAVAVWQASYSDFGGGGMASLTGKAEVRLRTRLVEAEHFSSRQGTQTLSNDSASGQCFIGDVSHGQHLTFDRVNLAGIQSITVRLASPTDGGALQFREDSPNGDLIAEIKFDATGDWNTWSEASAPIQASDGMHDLCMVFVNSEANGPFMNLDWLRFDK